MEMPNLVYNVIWVDDQIDTLIDMSTNRCLILNGINIIRAHSAIELRDIMTISYDRIDAVITDANMPKAGDKPKGERDLSGFEDVKSCIERYNQKRDIPFYLFSGRGDYLSERYENDELEYFEKNNRSFSKLKGEFPQLLEQLRKDVEHINSPSFRIRNKYRKELEAAKAIDGNEETLFQALLYDYSEDWGNTQDYFNPARKVVERIFDACKEKEIIPPLNKLNAFSYFLQGRDSNYEIKEGCHIMPKSLVHSLKYFLDITQDGSHGAGDLQLEVDEYVRNTKNINLFRTILYIAMDLCVWYQSICNTLQEDNVTKWQSRSDSDYKLVGVITNIKGKLVCAGCLLARSDNYTEGDKVGIRAFTDNNRPFTDDDGNTIDKFARAKDIFKIIN